MRVMIALMPCLMSSLLLPCLLLFSGVARADVALPPIAFTKFCLRYPSECQLVPAVAGSFEYQMLARDNELANTSIQPQKKRPFDDWHIYPRAGDCNDYAVSKRHTLLQQGWSSSQLLLAEVVIRETGEHHLLLIVRGARIWVLDNLRNEIAPIDYLSDTYDLVRVQTPADPLLWQTSFPWDAGRVGKSAFNDE